MGKLKKKGIFSEDRLEKEKRIREEKFEAAAEEVLEYYQQCIGLHAVSPEEIFEEWVSSRRLVSGNPEARAEVMNRFLKKIETAIEAS